MLTAKLGGSFLTALDLAAQVELESPLKRARGFSGHNLLCSGSVPAGVDSTQWYGQRGSLQLVTSTRLIHLLATTPKLAQRVTLVKMDLAQLLRTFLSAIASLQAKFRQPHVRAIQLLEQQSR